jgi:hypothetical protein
LKLHNFIIHFGTVIIIVAFFVAILFIKSAKPKYYKYIFAVIILGLLISANSIIHLFIKIENERMLSSIERVLLLFQFIALSFFYRDLLKESIFYNKTKRLIHFFIFIQITLTSISILFKIPSYVKIVPNFFLITYSVIYYRYLLKNKPALILIQSSAFWIVTGVFFSFCVSLPIYGLTPFMVRYPEYTNLRFQLFSISNMALIIMYLFIIKSYLCLKHPQNL